jgi:hypothetical protein
LWTEVCEDRSVLIDQDERAFDYAGSIALRQHAQQAGAARPDVIAFGGASR